MCAVLIPDHADIRAMALAQMIPVREEEWELALSARIQQRMWEFRLTPREQQICWLILRGHTDKEISQTLGIALSTTKNHLKNAGKKVFGAERPWMGRLTLILRIIGLDLSSAPPFQAEAQREE